ncbi:class I SAM-dependent methyltransferase [Falsibacillus albus]|uniref:Class I SAM-dependent methyltransferase n=1 Tax=Falsibacillus albus TaxID=2478915 RepID=A0A3L7JVI9_9BACI|nr:class I SAM-dependent methyltransferase [Falsibacillus albus]RLQ94264.1 class I SAM-dependent methyltransferase [Falsibacillus albus]
MNNSIKETYNRLAKTYLRNDQRDNPYNAYYERPAMMAEMPLDLKGKSVLDAGCAAGWYLERLVERGAVATGIDISPEMIKCTHERLKERTTAFCHDLHDPLPFQEDSFDIIISSLTLHYIREWGFVFKEFERALKRGGTILFSVHHPFMDFSKHASENYFQTALLTETWKKLDTTIDISFYRRSLQEMINVTVEHFQLEKVIEPRPQEKMKQINETDYLHLMSNPHFLIIKAVSKK